MRSLLNRRQRREPLADGRVCGGVQTDVVGGREGLALDKRIVVIQGAQLAAETWRKIGDPEATSKSRFTSVGRVGEPNAR
jgi:hypothetical protein